MQRDVLVTLEIVAVEQDRRRGEKKIIDGMLKMQYWLCRIAKRPNKHWLVPVLFVLVVGQLCVNQNVLKLSMAAALNRTESTGAFQGGHVTDTSTCTSEQMPVTDANLAALEQFFGGDNVMKIDAAKSDPQGPRAKTGHDDASFMTRQQLEYRRRNERVRRVCQQRDVGTSPIVLNHNTTTPNPSSNLNESGTGNLELM